MNSDRDVKVEAVIEKARRLSRKNGLDWFIRNVFKFSFDEQTLITGTYITEVADRMDNNRWTMDVSARDHFKSTRLYAEIMYDIFTTRKDLECHYFSYQQGMSAYHLEKLKKMIQANRFFDGFTDLSPMATSVVNYFNGEASYKAVPEGLLSFKRGIHAERIYIDDPLKDPENKLAPTVIYKINNIIKLEMFPMVKKGGICRVVGTPQTNHDFFFDESLAKKFSISVRPAIINEVRKQALFPEWKSYEELVEIRDTIGEKSFNQEYMTKPAYSENSYIERTDLYDNVDDNLKPVDHYDGKHDIYAGYDIGKKAHPSHLTIFERRENENGEYVYKQLFQKFLDNVDYSEQINYLKQVADDYMIDVLYYDNTRSEFESFAEQGLLPDCMKPVVFSMKQNNSMGANFGKVIKERRVKLINDDRQLDQILQVNNELQAIESPMGHGDSFWSNAMALMVEPERQYRVRGF